MPTGLRLFFSRHQLLTATYTTYTRYTRAARSGDAPGNSGAWARGTVQDRTDPGGASRLPHQFCRDTGGASATAGTAGFSAVRATGTPQKRGAGATGVFPSSSSTPPRAKRLAENPSSRAKASRNSPIPREGSRSTTPRHCQQSCGQVEKVLNRVDSCDRHRNGAGRHDPKLEDRRSARPGLPEQFEGCGQRRADGSSAGISQEIKEPAQWPAMLGDAWWHWMCASANLIVVFRRKNPRTRGERSSLAEGCGD